MRLSDIMSHAGLSIYAEIAMLLFFAAFIGILIRTFRPSKAKEIEALGRLPLEDGTPTTNTPGGTR